MTTSKPVSIHEELVTVTRQAASLRARLDARRSADAIEGLKIFENQLSRLSEIFIPFEQRYSHLQALAGIGQARGGFQRFTQVARPVGLLDQLNL